VDSEEMYRRGAADAERGEPNPFYYQHYYHYRRGFDRARRRQRLSSGRALLWLAPLALVLLAGAGFGAAALLNRHDSPAPVAALAEAPTARATPLPARTPIFPTATVAPSPTPVTLQVGGQAQVTNTEGRRLRGRATAGLDAPATVAFSEGERVRLVEGPVEADGYIWWRVEGPSGAGWSAERSPEGVVWLTPVVD
jgi:hypothetical protein